MSIATRPDRYTRWATDGGASVVEPNEGRKDIGWEADDEADESEFNWIALNGYEQERYIDERAMGYEYFGATSGWAEATLGPVAGATLTAAFGGGVLYLAGRRLELDTAWIAAIGEDSHVYTASRDTYVAVNNDRELEYNAVLVGNPAPSPSAGYTNIFRVETDATDVVEVERLLPSTPRIVVGWAFTGTVAHEKADAAVLVGDAWTVLGVTRWGWSFAADEDLTLLRYDATGTPVGAGIAFDATTGRVVVGASTASVADAAGNAPTLIVGSLGANNGICILGVDDMRLVFAHTSGTVAASIGADENDRLVLLSNAAPNATLALGGTDDSLRPALDNVCALGIDIQRFSEIHVVTTRTSEIRPPGTSALTIGTGAELTGAAVSIQVDQSENQYFELRTHLGAESGAFDADGARDRTKVAQTNTNGNEDTVLIDSGEMALEAAYAVTAEILGVRDGQGEDLYWRRLTALYENRSGGSITFVATPEDTGSSGGQGAWANATAGLALVSNQIVLRVAASDTTVRNWIVRVSMIKISNND